MRQVRSAARPQALCTYTYTAGSYTEALYVIDDSGGMSSAAHIVSVAQSGGPAAYAGGGLRRPDAGAAVAFDCSERPIGGYGIEWYAGGPCVVQAARRGSVSGGRRRSR